MILVQIFDNTFYFLSPLFAGLRLVTRSLTHAPGRMLLKYLDVGLLQSNHLGKNGLVLNLQVLDFVPLLFNCAVDEGAVLTLSLVTLQTRQRRYMAVELVAGGGYNRKPI